MRIFNDAVNYATSWKTYLFSRFSGGNTYNHDSANAMSFLSLDNTFAPASFNDAYNGDKWAGGFGETRVYDLDYYELRARSLQLFHDNLYARGIINRFVTNEVNSGLHLEAIPMESIIGVAEDSLTDWSEDVENRFLLWGKNKNLCDFTGGSTWGDLQRQIRVEALIGGDVLVLINVSKTTKLPQIQIVKADRLQTPLDTSKIRKGHKVAHGVEVDATGRHVAYYVTNDDEDMSYERVEAYGRNTGRLKAFLVYGTEKRSGEVRGVPLLSLVLQSLKEIDRYKDSTVRKAVINSMLAFFIEKTQEKVGNFNLNVNDDTPKNDPNRKFKIADLMPGTIVEELSQGEKPVPFSTAGTDVNFGEFEAAILRSVAWAFEMPPEILTLSFQSNYSASQAAINEYRIYLDKARPFIAGQVNQPVYETWLLLNVLVGKIKASGFLEAWRDVQEPMKFSAWIHADWTGAVKPSTDLLKTVKTIEKALELGLTTHQKAARDFNGSNFNKNMKQLKKENVQLKEAFPEPENKGANKNVVT